MASLQTTAKSGAKIAELLQKAAAAYEKGDERSANRLRATMGDASGPAAPPGGWPATAGAATGADSPATRQV